MEYTHSPGGLKALLENAGFARVELLDHCPQGNSGRLFIRAVRRLN